MGGVSGAKSLPGQGVAPHRHFVEFDHALGGQLFIQVAAEARPADRPAPHRPPARPARTGPRPDGALAARLASASSIWAAASSRRTRGWRFGRGRLRPCTCWRKRSRPSCNSTASTSSASQTAVKLAQFAQQHRLPAQAQQQRLLGGRQHLSADRRARGVVPPAPGCGRRNRAAGSA